MERRWESRGWAGAARLVGCLGVAALVQAAAVGTAAAAGPFTGFSGAWTGDGMVVFNNGATERIRCRSQYRTSNGDNALRQILRCASASYHFEVDAQISHAAGALSGTWTEKINQFTGQVSGTAADGRFRAVVRGSGFGASVNVTTSANGQAVTIRPQDERVREVSMQLRRN